MRHVYPNHEIPHLWAHQTQEEAHNSSGSFYFNGPTIFSYGSHFPIARHVINDGGERAILFTTASHSITTTHHCSLVRRAIPAAVPAFDVPQVQGSWGGNPNHQDNVESYIRRLSDLLSKARRSRTDCNREWREREALGLRQQLRRYIAFFDVCDVTVPESEELDALQSWIAAHQEEERQRREEAARLAEEQRRIEQAERIQRFRAGDPDTSYIPGVSPMLRIIKDEVQTSPGARFPVSHALSALAFVRQIRASGQEYVRNGHSVHLGHYAVDRIDPDGTVHAGCHVVPWDEIDRLAPQLERWARAQTNSVIAG
jgi:hypothetical protein